jgi:hypothetical protein
VDAACPLIISQKLFDRLPNARVAADLDKEGLPLFRLKRQGGLE